MRAFQACLWLSLLSLCCITMPSRSATPVATPSQPQMPSAPAPDVEAWLRTCPGAGLRNAKLYAARALGIELMKRSADHNQARSTLDIDRQFAPVLEQLRKRGLTNDELAQMEDAVLGLTELTAQNPVASQVESVVRMAESVAATCLHAAGRLGAGAKNGTDNTLLEHMGSILSLSQRLAMERLVSAFDTRQRTPAGANYVAQVDERLAALQQVAGTNQALLNTHALLQAQWYFLRRAVQNTTNTGRQPVDDVGRTSEIMFEVLEAEMRRLGRHPGA